MRGIMMTPPAKADKSPEDACKKTNETTHESYLEKNEENALIELE
jgi:hypothetical protein